MKKKKLILKSNKVKIQDLTHDTVPASVGLVKEVRHELRADLKSVDHKVESLNCKVESLDNKVESLGSKVDLLGSKVESLNSKVDSLQGEIKSVEYRLDSKIEKLSSKVEQVIVTVHRTQVLMEEQRGENRLVLDGIKSLIDRQDRLEINFDDLHDKVTFLSAGATR